MTPTTLDMLDTASECSISGLFQELLNKGIKTTPQHEPLKIGDSEGSDFKRLLHKKNKSETGKQQHHHHQDSPDFKPVIYLNNNSTNRSLKFGNSLYSFLFQHEDRYFNNDRDDLSKDIFPVGQQQAQ